MESPNRIMQFITPRNFIVFIVVVFAMIVIASLIIDDPNQPIDNFST